MAIRLRTLSGQTTTLADDNLEALRMTFQGPLLARPRRAMTTRGSSRTR
jgi:hypothetical protein